MSPAFRSMTMLAMSLVLFIAACTPDDAVKEVAPERDKTTTTDTRLDAGKDLLPPKREDPSVVASDALAPVEAFIEVDDPPQTTEDLLVAIGEWLPPDLVAGEAQVVFESVDGATVAVVSVIPELTWRGDPGFVESLIEALTGAQPDSPASGIFTANTDGGAVLELLSTGDGFVVASSHDGDTAVDYLVDLADVLRPNESWASGDCLFLDDDEDLPYAPFPPDVVVPCSGAHNAEVLLGHTTGTDLETFDADAVEHQRNYDCDRAYNETFGDQRTHAPGLVTYMPDGDEWDRGDRYLACVVIIDRNEGRHLFSGAMADLEGLAFEPSIGSCLIDRLPADTIDCSLVHIYQFVGDATIHADSWPEADDTVFDDACAPFLDDLETGPAELDIFPIGLGPYAFELGDRTVRCMAFATTDGFIVDVLGGFDEKWRTVGVGGVAA